MKNTSEFFNTKVLLTFQRSKWQPTVRAEGSGTRRNELEALER